MSFGQLLLQLDFLLPGSCIFTNRSVQNNKLHPNSLKNLIIVVSVHEKYANKTLTPKTAESQCVVSLKEYSDSASTFVMLFDEEWQPAANELRTAITPARFPLARQLYLYEQIRTEDLVCPNPHPANHVHSPDLASAE